MNATTTTTIGSDLFDRISYVQVEAWGSADFAYMDEAQLWVENELFCRASVVVDLDAVCYFLNTFGWSREAAEAQAVVDALAREYDAACEYVPEGVSFAPVLKADLPALLKCAYNPPSKKERKRNGCY